MLPQPMYDGAFIFIFRPFVVKVFFVLQNNVSHVTCYYIYFLFWLEYMYQSIFYYCNLPFSLFFKC